MANNMTKEELSQYCSFVLENERAELGISQEAMAKALGVSLNTYKRIITGDSKKLVSALQFLDKFYGLTGKMAFNLYTPPNNLRLQLIDSITRMSDTELKDVAAYVKHYEEDQGKVFFSSTLLQDSMRQLLKMYHKILKVNLTNKLYLPISVLSDEWGDNTCDNIQQWFSDFAVRGVHPDDLEDFKAFTNVENLKRIFRREEGYIRYRYRRMVDGEYHWVAMELIRSCEYANNNQIIMLYVRDIQDDYAPEE